MTRESPRMRRLRADRRAMETLRENSTVLDFTCLGEPAQRYLVHFLGRGLWRPEHSRDVMLREEHTVEIALGASYPRMMPDLTWKTPIFHPNISASGVVCLGGYGTHWVPSLNLDELCEMLWDMVRYRNFDVKSPYNREAAAWAAAQRVYRFPVDDRPIRDRIAHPDGRASTQRAVAESSENSTFRVHPPEPVARTPDVLIIDDVEVVDAEIVEEQDDIVFLD